MYSSFPTNERDPVGVASDRALPRRPCAPPLHEEERRLEPVPAPPWHATADRSRVEAPSAPPVNRPAVTVVIPTHNRADLMPATLASVLAQRDVDLRVVVIDDGSSDTTRAVLKAIDDPRLRWRANGQASGVSNARNTGLAMVETPWVAFTDDDDLWAPGKLARQFESLRMYRHAKWSVVGSVVVDDSLRILRHEKPPSAINLADRVLENNCVPAGGSGVLVSTALVREV